jgi:hypothetical protein
MAEYTTNINLEKQQPNEYVSIEGLNENFDKIDTVLGNYIKYEKAGGTGTAITLNGIVLEDGANKTFVVSANNYYSATTINSKPLYRPETTIAPKLIAGKAVTVWYSQTNDCFYISSGDTDLGGILAPNTDLNTVTTSGFYRLSGGELNAPPGTTIYNQLIVSGASDTPDQIILNHHTNKMFFRTSAVGVWRDWKEVFTLDSTSVLPIKNGGTSATDRRSASKNITNAVLYDRLVVGETILSKINAMKVEDIVEGSFAIQGVANVSDSPNGTEWALVKWWKLASDQYFVRCFIEWGNAWYDRFIVGTAWHNEWSPKHDSQYPGVFNQNVVSMTNSTPACILSIASDKQSTFSKNANQNADYGTIIEDKTGTNTTTLSIQYGKIILDYRQNNNPVYSRKIPSMVNNSSPSDGYCITVDPTSATSGLWMW